MDRFLAFRSSPRIVSKIENKGNVVRHKMKDQGKKKRGHWGLSFLTWERLSKTGDGRGEGDNEACNLC